MVDRPAGRAGQVCHKKLIDDMPKVSLSSHMNGLRSPLFLRRFFVRSTAATLQGYADLQPFLKKNELKAKQTALLLYHNRCTQMDKTNGIASLL